MSPLDLLPLQARIVLLAVAIIGAGIAGYKVRGWQEDAARLEAERAAHADYVTTVDAWAEVVRAVNTLRDQDHQQATADRVDFQRRLKDAKRAPLAACGTGLDPARPDSAGDPVRLTPAFVGLWNAALDIGLPAPLRASRDHSGRAAASASAGR